MPTHDNDIDLVAAIKISAQAYFDEHGQWGSIKPEVVSKFLAWLHDNSLETAPITSSDILMP
ncbi:MAG: hypothetical protein WA981_11205 [Glaciecola sp.]